MHCEGLVSYEAFLFGVRREPEYMCSGKEIGTWERSSKTDCDLEKKWKQRYFDGAFD